MDGAIHHHKQSKGQDNTEFGIVYLERKAKDGLLYEVR